MLDNTRSSHKNHFEQQRELKAMLRLVNDLGYEVQVTAKGAWVVSTCDSRSDHTVIAVDSANEVAAVAQELAEMLHIDQPSEVFANLS